MSAKLFHADCLDIMRSMKDNSVDMIVTDSPPHVVKDGMDWKDWIPTWLAEARRISPIVITMVGVKTIPLYPESDWIMCWWREDNNEKSRVGGFNQWLPVLVYGRPEFKSDIKAVKAIINPTMTGYGHPSAKPVALMEWLISGVKKGSTIMDPFMGSGPVGVACVKNGYNFIGVEIESMFFRVAERNIRTAESYASRQ